MILGFASSAAAQSTFAGAPVQGLKTDTKNNFDARESYPGNLIDLNKGNPSKVARPSDKIGIVTSGSTNTEKTSATVADADANRPNVELLNSVMPSGIQPPGTDLVFTIAFTNSGGQAAQVFTVVDPIPAQTDFKLDSPSTVLGTSGMTVVVEYSNDNASTWTYAPVSGGGGALDGYDRFVTHVRWRFGGNLSHSFPDNVGSVTFTARIQ